MHTQATQQITPHTRWIIRRDLPEILAIENLCFPSPWTEQDFTKTLVCRNVIGIAAEHDEQVVGFMVYELRDARLHLLNIAVHPRWQRQGVGRAMVDKLKWRLSPRRRTRITCEVREGNLDAQLWLKAIGFRCVEVRRDFYDTAEDAYCMVYRMPVTAGVLA